MKLFLEKLGMYPSEAELEEMFNMFDSNNSGMIDFPEFLSLMTKEFERDPLAQQEQDDAFIEKFGLQDKLVVEAEMRDAFNLFDEDQDGLITKKELFQTLERLGVKHLTQKEVEKMIDELAPLSNGYIDFQTFRKIVEDYI